MAAQVQPVHASRLGAIHFMPPPLAGFHGTWVTEEQLQEQTVAA